MDKVVACRPVELIFVDPTRLLQLARERGVPRAELIASLALEEIAERLSSAEAAWRAGEISRLAKVSRSLVGLSDEIGLSTMASVAGEVSSNADARDPHALAALVARLVRVGEHSLAAVGEIGHLRL